VARVSDTKQAEESEREKWERCAQALGLMIAWISRDATMASVGVTPAFESHVHPVVRDRILALAAENAELRARCKTAESVNWRASALRYQRENAELRVKLAAAEKVVRAARVLSIAHKNSDQFSLGEPEDLFHEVLSAYDAAATRKEPQP
jgi:hypothetical protein